jgi:polysaccharide biosynthesis/export protein
MVRGFTLSAAAVLAALAAGCAGAPPEPSDRAPLVSASPTGEYLIGPGDTLQVFVWREPELSVEVPVRPDGRITTPLVGDITAVGKTPTELARDIEQTLADVIRMPEVDIIVTNFVGTAGYQIRVLGQVTNPRSIGYRERMTLLDVMLEVGGLTVFAAGNRSRIVRSANGESREIRVRIEDLIKRGELEQNMLMRPGDIVIVPEAVF